MATFSPSPLDRFVQRTKLPWLWFVILVGILLFLLPFAVAYFDGIMDEFLYEGVWRNLLQGPAIIIYILALMRPMNHSLLQAIEGLREVIDIDDATFNQLVRKNAEIDDRAELGAFMIGAVFGFFTNPPWNIEGDYLLLKFYLPLTSAAMFGMITWIAFTSLASTKLQRELHRLPMKIDSFNLKPFEPIGRHSLVVALAFIGGCVISMIFTNPMREGFSPYSLIIYVILIIVSVLLFFLSMRPTHRLLAEKKRTELTTVQGKISQCFQSLHSMSPESDDLIAASTELTLWSKYEERLKDARTWPYNTAMLRTLFLSVLLPVAASIAQRIFSSFILK